MDFQLEKYKAFPYVAWTIFIGFAIFVGGLAMELYVLTDELARDSDRVARLADDNSQRLDQLEAALREADGVE